MASQQERWYQKITLSKKAKIVALPVLAAAILVPAIVIASNQGSDKQDTVKLSSTQKTNKEADVKPVNPVDTAGVDVQAQPQQPTTPPPQPLQSPSNESSQAPYGEDPNTPGVFRVFDKTAVMDAAGIAVNDRQYVEKIIHGWIYKAPSGNVNLCDTQPASKMRAIADDYEDNPITQLKWCNKYAIERYGSWSTAAERYEASRIF